jgi:hypothetical protein
MNLIKIAKVSFWTLVITGCGGGSPDQTSNTNNGTITTTDDGTNVSTGTDQSTLVPSLGTGSGNSFSKSSLDIAATTELAAGGSTSIKVNIVDTAAGNGVIVGTQYLVKFNSECAGQEPAKSSFQPSEALTSSGSVETFYQAEGCSGEDLISATLFQAENGIASGDAIGNAASGTVSVALAEVNNIEFVESSPSIIALKGLGFSALPETSAVSFAVKDEFNNPISGKTVTFSLTNNSEGVTLAGDSDADGSVESVTNATGVATAYVNSGTTHSAISVIAVTSKNTGGNITAQSFPILISTGSVDQNSYNLVVDSLNPHSWDIDGTAINFSVSGADSFNNPIPDGTQIHFMAESGQVQSVCSISDGGCSVTWKSANPRPGTMLDGSLKTNAIGFPGYDAAWQGGRAGVATVLAYTLGDGGFADGNGNGLLDAGESYFTMAEAFLDANEDGNFDVSDNNNPYEKLVDFDTNGVQTSAPVNYQGVACTEAARNAGHCGKMVHVRDQLSFIVADGRAATVNLTGISGGVSGDLTSPSIPSCINVRNEGTLTFSFNVADSNGNIPPVDTQVSFEAEGFDLVGSAPKAVPDAFSTAGINYSVTIESDDTFENGNAIFEVTSIREDVTGWTSPTLTDDPRILVATDSYLLDVSSGAQSQTVVYTFADACGNPPAANDIILFELANAQFTSTLAVTPTNKFQFSGADLNGSGQLTIVYEDDTTDSVGEVKITTIKGEFRSETTYEITD